MGGMCFLCNSPAHFGLFREIARDGGRETCPTWVCWPCHTSRPTLADFTPVAPLRWGHRNKFENTNEAVKDAAKMLKNELPPRNKSPVIYGLGVGVIDLE